MEEIFMRMNLDIWKICASCVYWDDPSQSAIRPVGGKGLWEVDMDKKCLCTKMRVPMKARNKCSYHVSKV